MGAEKSQRLKKLHGRGGLAAFALVLLSSLVCVPAAFAQNTLTSVKFTDKRVSLSVQSVFSELPSSGYVPVLVEIENGESRAFDFQFSFDSNQNGYGDNRSFNSGFGLRVEAGKDAATTFMVPVAVDTNRSGYSGGSSLRVNVSAGGLPGSVGSMHSNPDENYPSVALSSESSRLSWSQVKNVLSGGSSSSGNFGSNFVPEDLPANWLGYTGFDMLVISRQEWPKVSATSRKALLDWVRLGGRVVVWGKPDKPAPEALGLNSDLKGYGLGSVVLVGGGKGNPVGAGDLQAPGGSLSAQLSDGYLSGWGLQGAMGERDFKVGQIVLILIVFAILVGPVNLFVWAKPGKRHRLFFTTPLISIVASLILAGLIVIQDGFGGDGVRNTITYLDTENNQALTVQEQLARTGVLMSRSFTLEEPALVQPVAMNRSRWTFVHGGYNSPATNYSLSGSSLSGDFFRSRSEQGHQIRTVTPTRESIEQAGIAENGAPLVISSVAHPLRRLVYVDPGGNVWQAEDVQTGGKVTMKPWTEELARNWWNQTLGYAGRSIEQQAKPLMKTGRNRGRFFAESSPDAESSFAVPTLESIDWSMSHSLIVGKMKNAQTAPEKTL